MTVQKRDLVHTSSVLLWWLKAKRDYGGAQRHDLQHTLKVITIVCSDSVFRLDNLEKEFLCPPEFKAENGFTLRWCSCHNGLGFFQLPW